MARQSHDITVEQVAGRRALRPFVTFPFAAYRGDQSWVPPLIEERLDFLDPRKNPFLAHARAALFVARRGAEVVGTVSATYDPHYAALHGERQATFGFFEAAEPGVAAPLLAAAEAFGREQGATVMRGPMSFSINHEIGLLVEGFDTPPMVMMTHNPPWYAAAIEGSGYAKAMDMYAYIGDLDEGWRTAEPGVFRAAERAARKAGVRIRPVNLRRFDEELRLVKQIYQRAWQHNWGFVPLSDAEADHLAASLRPVIDPRLVRIAEAADGTPIGVSIGLPDLHQALRRSGGGSMFPLGLAKFLWERRRIDQFRLWGMGVVEEYRGRGIDAVFYVDTTRAALDAGYRRAEASWVLESNTMMNRILLHLGLSRYKTYRVYQKPIGA